MERMHFSVADQITQLPPDTKHNPYQCHRTDALYRHGARLHDHNADVVALMRNNDKRSVTAFFEEFILTLGVKRRITD